MTKTYIDGEKLRKCIVDEMGLSLTEASQCVGYSQSFFSRCISNGWVSDRMLKLIVNELGIPKEDFILTKESETEHPAGKIEGLQEAIAEGVMDGLMRFANSGRLNKEIYSGLRGAFLEFGFESTYK